MTITHDHLRRTVEALERAIEERDEARSRIAALTSERDTLRIEAAARSAVDALADRLERRFEGIGRAVDPQADTRIDRALADFEAVLRGVGEDIESG